MFPVRAEQGRRAPHGRGEGLRAILAGCLRTREVVLNKEALAEACQEESVQLEVDLPLLLTHLQGEEESVSILRR